MDKNIGDENNPENTGEKPGCNMNSRILVQIYEIQSPDEAEKVISLGIDHMGSVMGSREAWKNEGIKDAMGLRNHTPVKSALIPLFSDPDTIYRAADYYQPDIMHFCEALVEKNGMDGKIKAVIDVQEGFRARFPEIKTMRSLPIAPPGMASRVPTLALALLFAPLSDFFLTDTLLLAARHDQSIVQPEQGFVGITGKVCDWKMAEKLVHQSKIPVILAGGISPENVYDGIIKVQPAGIDSCTHTNLLDESGSPIRFRKDPDKVIRLVCETRRAELHISRQKIKDQ